jgi:hypothetical protein
LQEQADDFMKGEIRDANDYADWIKWVSNAEQGKQAISTTTNHTKVPVLLQVQQMDSSLFLNSFKEQLSFSDDYKANSRWEKIFQKIRVDQSLDEEKGQQL